MKRRKYWSGDQIKKPTDAHKDVILLGTTNCEGRSGMGIAKIAVDYWGAQYRKARGLSGRCYLMPIKNLTKDYFEQETGITYHRYGRRSLSTEQIRSNIEDFYTCARENPDKSFVVAYKRYDKYLNGYSWSEVWDMFTKDIKVPVNITFHSSYKGLPVTTG